MLLHAVGACSLRRRYLFEIRPICLEAAAQPQTSNRARKINNLKEN